METKFIFYAVAMVGVIFHLGMKLRDAYTRKEVFEWKYQIIFTGFSAATAIILVLFKPSIEPLIPDAITTFVSLNNLLLWFLIGYFADSVWKNVENTGKHKLNIE